MRSNQVQNDDEVVLIDNFYNNSINAGRSALLLSDLGWNASHRDDACCSDTYQIFNLKICHLQWDLSFFFAEENAFYYLDMSSKTVTKRYDSPDWDGAFECERVDVYEPPKEGEGEVVFTFDDPKDVWDSFVVNGRNMKYIIEHSVIWLST